MMRRAILTPLLLVLACGACGGDPPADATSAAAAPRQRVEIWARRCAGDCDAAEALLTPAFHRCQDEGAGLGGTTQGLIECDGHEFGRQEAALNSTLKRLTGKASPARRASLLASQAAWRSALELRGDDLGNQHGAGSAGLIMRSGARLRIVAQRRADLARFEAEGLTGPARP